MQRLKTKVFQNKKGKFTSPKMIIRVSCSSSRKKAIKARAQILREVLVMIKYLDQIQRISEI